MTVTFATKLVNVLGDKTAKGLAKAFDVVTVEDLMRHYPRRYAELGALTDLSKLEPGQHVTIMARVKGAKNYSFGPGGRRTRTEVVVTDGTGELKLTFFQQAWRLKTMEPGTLGLFAGQVTVFRNEFQLTHPDFEPINESEDPTENTRLGRGVIPLYRSTSALPSWRIEDCVGLCLDALTDLADPLPDDVRKKHGYFDMRGSLEAIHRPRNRKDYERARARFRFEEAFVIQTVFAMRRNQFESETAISRPEKPGGLRERFEKRLPFELTAGQNEVVAELTRDLSAPHPMHRLLQGEVGSGKTIVALLAMLQTVDAGGQAAMLAPTEVLAAQHYRAISTMLGDLAKGGMLGGADGATRVRLLTGSLGARARNESLLDAASGEAGIVVGTHALIQAQVQFADLGLVVVDEQHRFGVEQRAALADKSATKPHVLVMTATPIPRTVAMTVFGDLETSTLRELPAGRQPIQTTVVPVAERPAWLERAWQRVHEEVGKGRQAYVVVSRIGDAVEAEAEEKETRSLLDVYGELVNGPLSDLRVGMLHGRMSSDDKDAAMTAFGNHELDVLVATTVVEVGVDVPNASVMVVMDADRFGMSQLHQLRGRVGRGNEPGLCLLVTTSEDGTPTRERLDAVASTTDGFELSRLDVEFRREGDVLGARQSGVRSSLRLLSVVKHENVILEAREDADAIVAADPQLAGHPVLAEAVRILESTDQAEYLERT
ncbi:MAG: ATP-dependent DNA helicase RecG [Actinomycetota bacterium]|nr:ATP-dependent DNA helicase RecG [Actinomycetota bacterium]